MLAPPSKFFGGHDERHRALQAATTAASSKVEGDILETLLGQKGHRLPPASTFHGVYETRHMAWQTAKANSRVLVPGGVDREALWGAGGVASDPPTANQSDSRTRALGAVSDVDFLARRGDDPDGEALAAALNDTYIASGMLLENGNSGGAEIDGRPLMRLGTSFLDDTLSFETVRWLITGRCSKLTIRAFRVEGSDASAWPILSKLTLSTDFEPSHLNNWYLFTFEMNLSWFSQAGDRELSWEAPIGEREEYVGMGTLRRHIFGSIGVTSLTGDILFDIVSTMVGFEEAPAPRFTLPYTNCDGIAETGAYHIVSRFFTDFSRTREFLATLESAPTSEASPAELMPLLFKHGDYERCWRSALKGVCQEIVDTEGIEQPEDEGDREVEGAP